MRKMLRFWMAATAMLFAACSESNEIPEEEFDVKDRGLLIACEGVYNAGNASLSYYTPESKSVENEVFMRANGQLLGDVAQSITMYGNRCWICSNNSGVIFAIDPATFKEVGRIKIPGPRYIHFLNEEKAYVTQLWDNRIAVVNAKTYTVSSYIDTGMEAASASTEKMVQWGKYLFVNCWSYQKSILKIDTETDEIVGRLEVGIQPTTILLDKNGKLWTLCDGGQWEGNPLGYEAPELVRIDPESFSVEARIPMQLGEYPGELQLNAEGDTLYWLNNGVWCMSVESELLPSTPSITAEVGYYYGLTIDPTNGDIYVADALDFTQQGRVLRFSEAGTPLDSFTVGICPRAFCWTKGE